MTLNITTLNITTLNITTLNITTLSISLILFRRKSKVREKVPYDDPEFTYPNGDAVKKSPLYDEVSILQNRFSSSLTATQNRLERLLLGGLFYVG
jgi:hypothetical protein